MKVKFKHIDGITDVMTTPQIIGNEINLEYRHKGMSYGITIPLTQAIEMGIIKKVKANNTFREMKEGEIYPILSFNYAEDDIACTKGDMIIDINCGDFHYSNFWPAF